MVRPTTARPCCCKRAATAEESTPPDMATAMRPRCVSARSGRVSNWTSAFIVTSSFYRIRLRHEKNEERFLASLEMTERLGRSKLRHYKGSRNARRSHQE